MALTERTVEDQIEIVGKFRQLQVRTARIIEEDGVEITRTFHREVLDPDANTTNRSELVRNVSGAVWSNTVKNAWTLEKSSRRSESL